MIRVLIFILLSAFLFGCEEENSQVKEKNVSIRSQVEKNKKEELKSFVQQKRNERPNDTSNYKINVLANGEEIELPNKTKIMIFEQANAYCETADKKFKKQLETQLVLAKYLSDSKVESNLITISAKGEGIKFLLKAEIHQLEINNYQCETELGAF